MNCPENENVCSVKKENNMGYYRLHTTWKNNGFFINITSKDGAWRGEMTANDVKEMSSQLEVSPDTYLQQCKDVLTRHDGKQGMVYSVENGMFTWKKIVDEDSGIKIKMGSVMLEPASFVDTIQNFVDVALNCNKKLQNEVNDLTQKIDKSVANRNELKNKLNELIKSKEEMENDLYGRFLLVLNTKKKKILELENMLECEKSKNKPTIKQNLEDAYEIETEDEDIFENDVSPRKRKPEIKQNADFPPEEVCDQKKAKNIDEAVTQISLEDSDFFGNEISRPGPSRTMPKSRNVEIPSTKDELLDYFYGNS